jgi:hypothetical protein
LLIDSENGSNHVLHSFCNISLFHDEELAFRDIEFFLPQLIHMIVHFDPNCKSPSLERLLVVLCQTSLHISLQIMFILGSFMEDYQAEFSDGKRNPSANQFYFSKCARILADVERAAVYGNVYLSAWEKEILENTHQQLGVDADSAQVPPVSLEDLKKHEIAVQLTRVHSATSLFDGIMSGELFFKRNVRKSMFHSKGWKPRFFVLNNRCLICYREQYGADPLRAVHLQFARIENVENHPKYKDTVFRLINDQNHTVYQLRARNLEEKQQWMHRLSRYVCTE